ncbi:unnamed protein product [Penicillium salamii]|nr:unnamed protein product [Penicillium salamii]CAG8275955.1 unnamed protein product [Penicillium salamii]CAG8363829.1 unnamed protein product [Penicillium salamii]
MPNGRSRKWPTLVGDVTCSERHTKLEEEIKFWINNSDSSANAPITISVLRDKIMAERWKGNDNKPPSPNQKIEIVRNPHPGCPRVNSQPAIQFLDVCLREKREEESDFVLTATDMEELARHIWAYQSPTSRSLSAFSRPRDRGRQVAGPLQSALVDRMRS